MISARTRAARCRRLTAVGIPIKILVPRVPIPLVLDAFEAVGICRVANLEPSDLRERAQGPLELNATCRIVIHIMRGNDLFRRNPLLHPALESFQQVVVGVDDRRDIRAVPEGVWTVSVAAMPHAGDHEETVEFLDFFEPAAVAIVMCLARQLCRYIVVC